MRERRRPLPRGPLPLREGLRREDGVVGARRAPSRHRGGTSTRTPSSRRPGSEEVCPFEVSLELAERADVVLGDYNYVFDPVVALAGARDPAALADALLLVDEAHNLVDRGRGYYSPSSPTRPWPRSRSGSAPSPRGRPGTRPRRRGASGGSSPTRRPSSRRTRPRPTDLVPLDVARLDDLRLDLESLLVRHLADLRAGGRAAPGRPRPRPLLHLRALPRRGPDGAAPGRGRARPGLRRHRFARRRRSAARDPLQGPVAPPRRGP